MSWEIIVSIVSALTSLATLAGVVYTAAWKLGRLELKVETIWAALVQQGTLISRPKRNGPSQHEERTHRNRGDSP